MSTIMKRNKRMIPISQDSSSRSESPESNMPSSYSNHHFTFDNLLSIITPSPEVLPTPWKSGMDLHTRTLFFYKVDLEDDALRITKSIRIRCREPLSKNGKPLLIPSLYIGDMKLHPSCATIILGHEEVRGEEDLMKLLHHVDFCPRTLVSGDERTVESRRPMAQHQQPIAQPGNTRTRMKQEHLSQEIPMVIDVQQAVSPESVAGPSEEEEPVNLELKSTLPYPYSCANCQVDNTTLWRRDPNGNPVCNACGLYYRMYGVPRPAVMRRDAIRTRAPKTHRSKGEVASAPAETAESIAATSILLARRPKRNAGPRDDLICSNCSTRNTILWRRNLDGNRVCNACALYTKLHGVPRPSDLWREEILKRRQKQRVPKGMKKPTMVPAKPKPGFHNNGESGALEGSHENLTHSPGEDHDHSPHATLASLIIEHPDDSEEEDNRLRIKTERSESPLDATNGAFASASPQSIHSGDH